MQDTYVEYILSQCSDTVIPAVCAKFKSKDELLKEAYKGFNGKSVFEKDTIVIESIDILHNYIDDDKLNTDAIKLYNRIFSNLKSMNYDIVCDHEIDNERLFETLVDLNWLIASCFCFYRQHRDDYIPLINRMPLIRINIRMALNKVFYKQAFGDLERSQQYKSATKLKYQIFSGLHPDQEVRELYGKGYLPGDFIKLSSQAQECGVRNMTIYFALTATAALAEQIWRGV